MKITSPSALILGTIKRKGETQSSVSKKVGMSACNFSLVVTGKRRVSGRIAYKIQDAIGLKAETILRLQFEKELNELKQVRKVKGSIPVNKRKGVKGNRRKRDI